MRIFGTSLLILLSAGRLSAQASEIGHLRVRSNLAESLILVDSAFVGVVGDDRFLAVEPGIHVVGVAPSEVGSWALSPPETEVSVQPGDSLTILLDFPTTYRIDTVPFGATVFREDDDVALGQTPLVFTTESALRAALILEKRGYATERIIPGTEVVNQHSVSLRPISDDTRAASPVEWDGPPRSGSWLTYSALGLVAAGGALAVHFKFRADDRYDEYLITADPETKNEVDRLDRLSYVALGGMQVGIGLLVYKLAF